MKKIIKMQDMKVYFVLRSSSFVLEQTKLNTINSAQEM